MPFMTAFQKPGWVMVETGVPITPASISQTVKAGIIAFQGEHLIKPCAVALPACGLNNFKSVLQEICLLKLIN